MSQIDSAIYGKNIAPQGVTPAIALLNPKYADNVAKAVRLASCYGLAQVWFSGDRVRLDPHGKQRLPREERMKGYLDVQLRQHDYIFDQFRDATPVAVEVRENSESLFEFEHPDDAIYVFGPEDGSIAKSALAHCHRFVIIPTRHCLNLATAVATVLWDRQYKRYLAGHIGQPTTPGKFEQRGIAELPEGLCFPGE